MYSRPYESSHDIHGLAQDAPQIYNIVRNKTEEEIDRLKMSIMDLPPALLRELLLASSISAQEPEGGSISIFIEALNRITHISQRGTLENTILYELRAIKELLQSFIQTLDRATHIQRICLKVIAYAVEALVKIKLILVLQQENITFVNLLRFEQSGSITNIYIGEEKIGFINGAIGNYILENNSDHMDVASLVGEDVIDNIEGLKKLLFLIFLRDNNYTEISFNLGTVAARAYASILNVMTSSVNNIETYNVMTSSVNDIETYMEAWENIVLYIDTAVTFELMVGVIRDNRSRFYQSISNKGCTDVSYYERVTANRPENQSDLISIETIKKHSELVTVVGSRIKSAQEVKDEVNQDQSAMMANAVSDLDRPDPISF